MPEESRGSPISIAVIGTGRFGLKHAKRLKIHPQFLLRCTVDCDERARGEAAQLGVPALASINDLPPDIRAATIAVSSAHHAELAIALMKKGIDVLVEKPLATQERQLVAMLDAAEVQNRILVTGHIERFNPWMEQISHIESPKNLEFDRQSSIAGSTDDAILDLMVHDLDLAAILLKASPDAPMQIEKVEVEHPWICAFVRLKKTPIKLRCSYGASRPYAHLEWSDLFGKVSKVELSTSQNCTEKDAITRQYDAFYAILCGNRSSIASGAEGAASARRAMQILNFPKTTTSNRLGNEGSTN